MTTQGESRLHRRTGQLIMIIALGSICGLIEVVLSGALRATDFPWRVGVLIGLGFGIVGFALAIHRQPVMALWIALVAVLVKQMTVPLLGVSIMCKANSCLAVGIEYAALAGVSALTMRKMAARGPWRSLTGGAAALIASLAFLWIGRHVAPCTYLLSFGQTGGFVSYLHQESLNWVVFSAVLFPIGWSAGTRSEAALVRRFEETPRVAYAGAFSLTVLCWTASALAIAGGM